MKLSGLEATEKDSRFHLTPLASCSRHLQPLISLQPLPRTYPPRSRLLRRPTNRPCQLIAARSIYQREKRKIETSVLPRRRRIGVRTFIRTQNLWVGRGPLDGVDKVRDFREEGVVLGVGEARFVVFARLADVQNGGDVGVHEPAHSRRQTTCLHGDTDIIQGLT